MKLAIGLPAYRSVIHAQHAAMWLDLGREAQNYDLEIVYTYYVDCCGVEVARNRLLHDALVDPNGIDWLLMCDSDNAVLGDARQSAGQKIGEMLKWMKGEPRPVAAIGAPSFKRGNASERGLMNVSDFIAGQWRRRGYDDLAGEVRSVGRLGTGFIAINLAWIRQVWPKGPWFQIVYPEGSDGQTHLGEDDWFCDEVHRRDGIVLCDGRFVAAHSNARTE